MLAWIPLAFFVAPPGLDPIRADPNTGEWICNVAVNAVTRNPQTGQSELISSIEIAVRVSDAAFYASGWFSYLALSLSAGLFSRKQVKRAAWGFGLQTVVNTLSLAGFVYILAQRTLAGTAANPGEQIWWIKYFDHINTLVIPFASPFLVAMLMHPEWRELAGLAWPVKTESAKQAPKRGRREPVSPRS